jgi:hypothetical protein
MPSKWLRLQNGGVKVLHKTQQRECRAETDCALWLEHVLRRQKAKRQICPCEQFIKQNKMKAYEGSTGITPRLLSTALHRGGQLRISAVSAPRTHRIRSRVCSRTGLAAVEKRKNLFALPEISPWPIAVSTELTLLVGFNEYRDN